MNSDRRVEKVEAFFIVVEATYTRQQRKIQPTSSVVALDAAAAAAGEHQFLRARTGKHSHSRRPPQKSSPSYWDRLCSKRCTHQ